MQTVHIVFHTTTIRISVLQLVNSTVEDVSLQEVLAYESIAGALERRIEGSVDWTGIAEIEILGLDEIALKENAYVASFEEPRDGEGGAGVTVAKMAK